jgi:hypothetical protein
MTVDMTNNRVPYGLLTDEEKAALHEHEKAGGAFVFCGDEVGMWHPAIPVWTDEVVYRTVPLPKTQDVIAWEKLPDWVEWVARDGDGMVLGYVSDPPLQLSGWYGPGGTRIDDFPGIVQIGTVDWKDSKQRRQR